MLPGHATCRHLRRYRSYHARTLSRWYARDVDVVSLNQAAIIPVIPPAHAQALGIDASFVPNSGQQTDGLDRFWNGSHRRTDKGLEISALAWLDITANGASCRSAAQTPPADKTTDTEATRIDVSLAQWARVVSAHHLRHRRSVITDGDDRTQKVLRGVRALRLAHIGTLRLDAHRRARYQGPQRPGPGRPNTDDGKVHGDTLSRCETVETEDDDSGLSPQVLNHVPCQRHLRVVLVVDTTHHRNAGLFRTDLTLDALTLDRSDKARFHSELLCRDAQQLTGLTDGQARSPAQLTVHCHARLSAVTLATLDARQHNGETASAFSMASLKRRAFHQHRIEHISQY